MNRPVINPGSNTEKSAEDRADKLCDLLVKALGALHGLDSPKGSRALVKAYLLAINSVLSELNPDQVADYLDNL